MIDKYGNFVGNINKKQKKKKNKKLKEVISTNEKANRQIQEQIEKGIKSLKSVIPPSSKNKLKSRILSSPDIFQEQEETSENNMNSLQTHII